MPELLRAELLASVQLSRKCAIYGESGREIITEGKWDLYAHIGDFNKRFPHLAITKDDLA